MEYVIVAVNGKQYWLKPETTIHVDGIHGEVGKTLSVGSVLAMKNGQLELGQPTLEIPLNFRVLEHTKSEKIRVATYRSKSRYRKVKGHRQDQTVLQLETVGAYKAEAPKQTTEKTKQEKPAKQANAGASTKRAVTPKADKPAAKKSQAKTSKK